MNIARLELAVGLKENAGAKYRRQRERKEVRANPVVGGESQAF